MILRWRWVAKFEWCFSKTNNRQRPIFVSRTSQYQIIYKHYLHTFFEPEWHTIQQHWTFNSWIVRQSSSLICEYSIRFKRILVCATRILLTIYKEDKPCGTRIIFNMSRSNSRTSDILTISTQRTLFSEVRQKILNADEMSSTETVWLNSHMSESSRTIECIPQQLNVSQTSDDKEFTNTYL